ncbi:MAG: MFS transporter [Solirubrobacteraceae bacterium]
MTDTTPSSPGRGLARFPRPLRAFLVTSFQSSLGNEMAYVALLLLAYEQTKSGWAITGLLIAEFLPGLLLAGAAGALADRGSRRTLVVATDVVRCAAYAGLAFSPSITVTLVLATVASVGQTVFRPASRSAIPSLTDEDGIGGAMGALSFTGSVAGTAGPLLAGAILLAGGPSTVLLVNAATFLVSAMVLARLPLDRAPAEAEEGDEDVAHPDGLRGTVRLLGSLGSVPAVFVAGVGATFAFAMINVAEPLLVRDTLGGDDAAFALLVALFGAGATVGSALARTRLSLMFVAGAGSVGTVGLTAAAGSVGVAGVLFAVSGLFAGLFITTEDRLLATLVPQGVQGRVYGFKDALESAAFLVAYVIAGGLAAVTDPPTVFVVSAATALVLGVAALRWVARPAPAAALGAPPTADA